MGQLIRDLATDMGNLVRQEIALARAELVHNIRSIAKHLTQVAAGAGVAVIGMLVLVAFLVVGLGVLLGGAYWLSSLLVAIGLLVGGAGLAFAGARGMGRAQVAPEESLESVRATQRWLGSEVQGLRQKLSGNGAESPAGTALVRPAGGEIRSLRGGEVARHRSQHPGRPDRDRDPDRQGGAAGSSDEPSGAHNPGASPPLPLSEPIHKRVLHEIRDDDVTGQGAKVAFFMFTSLPPALLVLFGLAGFFGGEELAAYLTERMADALPGSANDPDSATGFLSSFIDQVVNQRAPGPFSIGLVLGVWAGSAVFVALTESLNIAFDVGESRSWFRRRAIALGVMIGFLLLFLGGSIALIAGPQIAGALGLGGVGALVWGIVQWPLAFLLVVAAFFLVYYILPNRNQAAAKVALFKASAAAAALWLLATLGFRLYIANFGSYSESYGFVGAILVLLLWMYLTGTAILVGGEIASEMEREAA